MNGKQIIRNLFFLLPLWVITACNDNMLLENLSQQQANQILAILQQHDIASQKKGTPKTGYSINVKRDETTAALSVINQYQLPWPAEVQIAQAFPESALVSSPNAEQARVISLQEQRLEQSLRMIDRVVNAKAHLSYPSFDNNVSEKNVTQHASVIITHNDDIDENLFIPQVKSLIKNTLNNLRYDNISVVLFPAPALQYASPTHSSEPSVKLWVAGFTLVMLATLAAGGYLFCKTTGRTPRLRVKMADTHVQQLSREDNHD